MHVEDEQQFGAFSTVTMSMWSGCAKHVRALQRNRSVPRSTPGYIGNILPASSHSGERQGYALSTCEPLLLEHV